MVVLEEMLGRLDKSHPTAFAIVCFAVVFAILLAIVWFFVFSGLNASADFVYNQF